MQATGRRDTKPEMALRRALHALGYRYRVDQTVLQSSRRRADLVFTKAKVAVFVDGCFWHGCKLHRAIPKTNSEFWRSKIETNRLRDRDTDALFAREGWLVIRIWEHCSVEEGVARVVEALSSRSTVETVPKAITELASKDSQCDK